MAGTILHHCLHCGTGFARSRPDANRQNFCSEACRFWSKVDRGSPDGCWNWTAKARSNSGDGYGAFNRANKIVRSHRVAWELTNGPIPNGLHVCHRCDNSLCCNPSHLFLGTHQDNMRDMLQKGRHAPMSPDMVERLRAMKIGKPRSPEVREKLSKATRAYHEAHGHPMKGSKASDETRQKLRDAWVRRKARDAQGANP